jgi:hypothetical protein
MMIRISYDVRLERDLDDDLIDCASVFFFFFFFIACCFAERRDDCEDEMR